MSDIERQLSDGLADGRLTVEDAAQMQTFAQFLVETPKAVKPNLHGQGARDVRECFGDDDAFDAWRMRWLPYLAGLADGPTTPKEYAALLPQIKVLRG